MGMFIEHTATILSGQTTSSYVQLGYGTPVAIYFPASFEGTEVTFSGARTAAGTYHTVLDGWNGGTLTLPAGANSMINVLQQDLCGMLFMKITIATGGPVAADREIIVVTKNLK